MRTTRLLLSAALLAVAAVPAAASAGNQCNPYFYEEQVGPVTVTSVGVAC